MTTSSRKLPITVGHDGLSTARTTFTPKAMKTPGEITVRPKKVMPVIFVPGIMGSNLCARPDLSESHHGLDPGEVAWRPPNGKLAGAWEAYRWHRRDPSQRQRILHGPSLIVDDRGDIDIPLGHKLDIDEEEARARGWGQIHWESYGLLLSTFQRNLNSILCTNSVGSQEVKSHWREIMNWDRNRWNTRAVGAAARISIDELERAAAYYYAVYAFGYNWLLTNQISADRLVIKINQIIKYWQSRKKYCQQVILVTHSMGGLVARAAAKTIPDKIAGLVHGVMPALGAPVCYRRIAYGTESTSPRAMDWKQQAKSDAFAIIAGKTAAETTPVLATSPGPLELLPNHMYPRPWLLFRAEWKDDPIREILQLPKGNPYDLYRDTMSWYRMIDPNLVDPANLFQGDALSAIRQAINKAEAFHTRILDSYYHPNTYAFYGNDRQEWCFGSCQWITKNISPDISSSAIATGRAEYGSNQIGVRSVWAGKHIIAIFNPAPQDTSGDGTVPIQSGRGPAERAKQTFETSGYDHQGSYQDSSMLALTQHLILKIMQIGP